MGSPERGRIIRWSRVESAVLIRARVAGGLANTNWERHQAPTINVQPGGHAVHQADAEVATAQQRS